MGLKILSSQKLQFRRIFSREGRRGRACEPQPPSPARSSSVKIIGLEGQVTVYRRRIKAGELMEEHACHLVCRSDSFFIGQKVPALSAAEELQLGQCYFLLPTQFFHSVLPFVTVASSIAKGGGKGSLRHFNIHRTDGGKLQIRVCEEFEKMMDEEEEEIRRGGAVCTTSVMVKEYDRLVGANSRQWKPKLEAIAESPEKMRRTDRSFCGLRSFRRENRDSSLSRV